MAERILIIDDDLDTLAGRVDLAATRYQIVAANSGSQGLAKAAAEKPNLIFVRCDDAGHGGYEVTSFSADRVGARRLSCLRRRRWWMIKLPGLKPGWMTI